MTELNRCFRECWEEHETMIEEVQRKHAITLKRQFESWYKRGWMAAGVYCEHDDANYWKQEYIKLQNAILEIGRESKEI